MFRDYETFSNGKVSNESKGKYCGKKEDTYEQSTRIERKSRMLRKRK